MASIELERIRFVTRHFHELQGLRVFVWIGLWLLTSSLSNGLLHAGLELSSFAVSIVGTVSMIALGYAARGFYRRRFGHVDRRPGQWTRAHLGIGLVILVYLAALSAGVGPLAYCIGMSVTLVAGWVQFGAPASLWYRPALGIFLAVALGPRAIAMHSAHDLWELQTPLGLAFVLVGLLDHRFLVQTMAENLGAAEEPDEEMELLEPR